MPWDEDDYYDGEWIAFVTGGLRYDRQSGSWACGCAEYYRKGKCRHVNMFRRVTHLAVREEYL